MSNTKYILIITTVSSKREGDIIASNLVENNLAACVNIIPNITSIYKWQNELHKEKELILFIKSTKNKEQQIIDIIKDMHSYDLPELITININNIDKKYAEWLNLHIIP